MKHNDHAARITWTYDDRGVLSMVCRYAADGTVLECIALDYDDAGNPRRQTKDGEPISMGIYHQEGRLQAE